MLVQTNSPWLCFVKVYVLLQSLQTVREWHDDVLLPSSRITYPPVNNDQKVAHVHSPSKNSINSGYLDDNLVTGIDARETIKQKFFSKKEPPIASTSDIAEAT